MAIRTSLARAMLVSIAVLAGLSVPLLPRASAAAPVTVVACGYSTPSGVDTSQCESFADALATAQQAATTIELMPGDYCPTTITLPGSSPSDNRAMVLEGVGLAAFASGSTPPPIDSEAELTQFIWNAQACGGGPPPSAALAFANAGAGLVTLRDLAVEAVSGGPTIGVDARPNGLLLALQHVVVRGFDTGIDRDSDLNQQVFLGLTVEDSAVIDNTVGIDAQTTSTITSTTIAENTTGLQLEDGTPAETSSSTVVALTNDTISDNGVGVSGDPGVNVRTVVNDLIAGNTTADCTGDLQDGTWEQYGTIGHNLVGPGCPTKDSSDTAAPAGLTVAEPADNGGPTPSIASPATAIGGGDATQCPLLDQRAASRLATDECDIGAVDSTGNDTVVPGLLIRSHPGASGGNTALDYTDTYVAVDDSHAGVDDSLAAFDIEISNTGGGQLAYAASSGGPDIQIMRNTCGDRLFLGPISDACDVGGTIVVTQRGSFSDSIQLIGAGDTPSTTIAVSGVAADPPGAPTSAAASPGPHNGATLTWTPPTDDGGAPVTSYTVNGVAADGSGDFDYPDITQSVGTSTSADIEPWPGHAWSFQVQACNAVGCSAGSNTTSSLTVPPDHTTITAPQARTIDDGESVILRTTAVDTDQGEPVPDGTEIDLLASTGGGAFKPVATEHSGPGGTAKASVTPKVDTRYKWHLNNLGFTDFASATSSVGEISVQQVVTAALKPASVKTGKTARIYGTVTPAGASQRVQLQRRTGGAWHAVGKPTVIKKQKLPDGKTEVGYVIDVSESKAGSYVLRVEKTATSANAGGISPDLTLRVTKA